MYIYFLVRKYSESNIGVFYCLRRRISSPGRSLRRFRQLRVANLGCFPAVRVYAIKFISYST